MKQITKLLLLVSLLLVNTYAKDLKVESTLITGKLDNGFEYTIKKNAKPVDKAEIRLLVKAGALDEDDDQKGIAHLVEHMAFNGSEHFPGNSLITYLESIGVAFGSHLNASTGTTRTLYKLSVPLENDNLDKSLLIFEDWAGGLSFNPKELEKERGVVLEEARSRDNLNFRLYMQSKDTIYEGSKYKDRTPIGDLDIVRNIKIDRVKAFYTRWYRAELMHLVVVGDVDVLEVEALIKKHFAHLKNANHDKRASRSVPKIDELRTLFVSDEELVGSSVDYYFFNDAKKVRSEADYREALELKMALSMYNIENANQLTKANPVLNQMRARSSKLGDNLQIVSFSGSYDGNDKQEALEALSSSIFGNDKYGFKQESFDAIKQNLQNSNELARKKLGDKDSASYADKIVSSVQSENIFIDEMYQYELLKTLLNEVSLEDVKRRYSEVLKSKSQLISFASKSKNRLTQEEILLTLKEAKANLKKPEEPKKLPNKILAKELEKGKIVSEIEDKKHGVKGFELENGVRVFYKFNDYAKRQVNLYAYSSGGFSLVKDELLTNAKYAPKLISASGTKEFTKEQMKKINAGKSLSLTPFISRYSEGFSGRSTTKDFAELLELVYLASTDYTLNENILNNTIRVGSKKIEQENTIAKVKFDKEYSEFYTKGDPRYKSETKESLATLNKKDALKIYADRFSDANNFTYIIVGDIEYERVKELASLYLANLPTKMRVEQFKDRASQRVQTPAEFIRFYEKQNISTLTLNYETPQKYTLNESIKLQVLKDVLSTKLREFIREEKSGVYGVRVKARLAREPIDKAIITISFTCDPKRRAELLSSVKETINIMKKDVVADKYVDAVVKTRVLNFEQGIKSGAFWSERIKRYVEYGDSLSDVEKYETFYNSITPKDIQKMAQKYLKKDALIYRELNPEN